MSQELVRPSIWPSKSGAAIMKLEMVAIDTFRVSAMDKYVYRYIHLYMGINPHMQLLFFKFA